MNDDNNQAFQLGSWSDAQLYNVREAATGTESDELNEPLVAAIDAELERRLDEGQSISEKVRSAAMTSGEEMAQTVVDGCVAGGVWTVATRDSVEKGLGEQIEKQEPHSRQWWYLVGARSVVQRTPVLVKDSWDERRKQAKKEAEAIGRATGSRSATYRVERRNSDGSLSGVEGEWKRGQA